MPGQHPHRAGQILEHGYSQLWMAAEHLIQLPLIHGDRLTFRDRHGGSHPGTLVEKGSLPHQIARPVDGEHPFFPGLGADKAPGCTGQQIVKMVWLGAL